MKTKLCGHHRTLAGIIYLALALLVSACSPTPEPPLRIGTNVWPGYEPLYLARSLGYYKESSVNLVEMTSAPEVIQALRSGTLEGAALTLDEALTLLDDELDLKVILVMDFSHGGDVLLARPGIAALGDLRDKRIGVEQTAVGALLLDAALDAAGLRVSDVEIVYCAANEHVDCYWSGDAVVTFEPIKTALLKQGAWQLFDSSRIPGRIVDVLVVHADSISTHPRSLEYLLAGYFKAREYLVDAAEDAGKRMAPRMALSPAEVLASFKGLRLLGLEENQTLLSGNPSQLQATASELAGFMLERKLLRNRLTIENLSDSRFLPGNKP